MVVDEQIEQVAIAMVRQGISAERDLVVEYLRRCADRARLTHQNSDLQGALESIAKAIENGDHTR